MTQPEKLRDRRWAIVLAGGEGRRLQPLVSSWLGRARPKQFCAFFGDRTLLEHTWSRAECLADPERILTVIGPGQGRYMLEAGLSAVPGRVLEQPANLDTAPGIFLALTHVMAADPDATVVVMPSDHWAHPEAAFVDAAGRAADLAARLGDRLVLLGAVPDRPEPEYGWIGPGDSVAGPVFGEPARVVVSFHEKPDPELAETYYYDRFLWNTMVVAAPARALWQLGQLALPHLSARFEGLLHVLRAVRAQRAPVAHEDLILPHLYGQLEPASFSRQVLEPAADSTVVLTMEGVRWSDWGNPERLLQDLSSMGRDLPEYDASTSNLVGA